MSGRVSEDSDGPKGPHGGGVPTVNGSIEATLTPELLFRMNKKIAQLTKVGVYSIQTLCCYVVDVHSCVSVCVRQGSVTRGMISETVIVSSTM